VRREEKLVGLGLVFKLIQRDPSVVAPAMTDIEKMAYPLDKRRPSVQTAPIDRMKELGSFLKLWVNKEAELYAIVERFHHQILAVVVNTVHLKQSTLFHVHEGLKVVIALEPELNVTKQTHA